MRPVVFASQFASVAVTNPYHAPTQPSPPPDFGEWQRRLGAQEKAWVIGGAAPAITYCMTDLRK